MKKTKYFVLFEVLKAAGSKGATPAACAKALNFAVGSVAPYIHALRLKFKADVEVVKNGRNVVGYKLLNVAEVEGVITPNRRASVSKAVKPSKPAKAAKATKVATVAKSKPKVQKVTKTVSKAKVDDGSIPTLDSDLEISEVTDRELNDIKAQLGI